MNWEAIGAIGEILGAVGVILTLIYLATQLSQNTKAMRSTTYEGWANSSSSVNDFIAQNPSVFVKINSGEALTDEEAVIYGAFANKLFVLLESAFLHHQEGSMPKGMFDSRAAGLKKVLTTNIAREAWRDNKQYGYEEDFVNFVEHNLIDSS